MKKILSICSVIALVAMMTISCSKAEQMQLSINDHDTPSAVQQEVLIPIYKSVINTAQVFSYNSTSSAASFLATTLKDDIEDQLLLLGSPLSSGSFSIECSAFIVGKESSTKASYLVRVNEGVVTISPAN